MLWMSVALASSLLVERASHALIEERPGEAVDSAREAIQADIDDAEAWDVYLQACEAAGLKVACDAEASLAGDTASLVALRRLRLAGAEVEVPEIGDALLRRVANGDAGVDHPLAWEEQVSKLAFSDPDAAADRALELLGDHPGRPDVLAGLFDPKIPPVKSIAKAKKKITKLGAKRIGSAEPAELYRWLALWVATDAHDAARKTADRLAELGEKRPLDRKLLTRAEQVHLAQAVIQGTAELPSNDPVEAEAVALKVANELRQRGRIEDAAKALAAARKAGDTASLAMAEAEALLAIKEYDRALTAAQQALQQVGEAWPSDRGVLLADVRQHALAKALGLRGRVHLAAGRKREAAIDLMIANQLANQPVDGAELEKAFSAERYQIEMVKAKLETRNKPAHQRGLELAREALEAGDTEKARQMLADTIAVLVLPAHSKARLTDPLPGRVFLADAIALRGAMADDADRDGDARTDLLTALLLRRWTAPAAWWARLAKLRSTDEARFFADAMAAALDEELERSVVWPGVAEAGDAAAAAMVASWLRGAPVEDPDAVKITTGIVMKIPQGGGRKGGGTTPSINAPFPNFVLQTPHGEVGLRLGRITLITFFRADSPNSRRAMRELSLLAQEMRRVHAIDAILVGVSVDPEEKTLIDLQGERDTWGPNGWDPELGKRFGVEAVPTTFVVDTQGVARFQHVGYLGTAEYEAELRLLGGI